MKSLLPILLLTVVLLGGIAIIQHYTSPKEDSSLAVHTQDPTRMDRITRRKQYIDSINQQLAWKPLNESLWISKRGDIGIHTSEGNEEGIDIEKYITHLYENDTLKPMSGVIDTATFAYLGSSFYKDKHYVYTHYTMSDGGYFAIVAGADVASFHVIGSCYAKDKNAIYGERALRMDSVDYASFIALTDCGCFAKDKNNLYFWDDKIQADEMMDETSQACIEKLKAL